MKVSILMFGNKEQKIYDQQLFKLKDHFIQTNITPNMKLCNISKVKLNHSRHSGISILTNMEWDECENKDQNNLPDVIKQIRPYILFNIKSLMEILGIHVVEITLNEEEIAEQNKYWSFIEDKDEDGKAEKVEEDSNSIQEINIDIQNDLKIDMDKPVEEK